ncbi:MAG TPA: hypothetical protein VEQ65_12055, partial [Opitutus sp.]|nr:hypothetical protein [Opitutus sp.]
MKPNGVIPETRVVAAQPLRVAFFIGLASALVGLGSMAGWASGTTALIRVVPDGIPMSPATSAVLILIGIALGLSARAQAGGPARPTGVRQRRLAQLLATGVLAAGVGRSAVYGTGW